MMKRVLREKIGIVFLIFPLVLGLSTCEQLTPGLGEEVDLDPPELSIVSHSNGDYVQGNISLTGTAVDDIEVASVAVSHEDEVFDATLEGDDWSLSVDTSTYVDGDHEFRITAADGDGREAAASIYLIIDNSPPTVMITVPEYYGADQEFNKSFTIKGEAADTTRVKEVFVSLFENTGAAVFEEASATGTSSWYYTFNAEDLDLSGVYHFLVEAEDFSGNRNTYFYHFDDVLNAASSAESVPNIEEINGDDYQGTTVAAAALEVSLSSLRRNTDEENRVEVNFNPDSDMPEFTFISPGLVVSPADPLEENVFSSPQRLSGFVEDDDGVDFSTLELRIMDYDDDSEVEPWTVIDSSDISGTQWSYTTNLSDGNYYVQLTVDDIYGKTGTSTIAPFRVSSFAPVITIQEPSQGSYVGSNSVFDVAVTVSALGSGTVELDPTGDDDWSDAVSMTETDGVYSVSMDGGVSGNFTPEDGAIIFKLRAGVSGNYGTTTLQLTGDIELPTVTVEVPSEGESVNGALNFAGTTGDNNLIKSVYLWIEEDGDTATETPEDLAFWLSPDGTDLYNWFYYKDTAELNSGLHYLHVKAFDAADNPSADLSSSFTVDQESDRPVVSLSNMVIGGTGLENGLGRDASIIGLVEDDDGVDSTSIEVRIDIYNNGVFDGVDLDSSGAVDYEADGYEDADLKNESEQWLEVSNHPDNTTRIVSWSHSLVNIPQGTHSMQIRVHDTVSDGTTHDLATNTNYNEIDDTLFIIDYGPPDLIISSPANGEVFNAEFTIEGSASDTNGVDDVSISINGGSFSSLTDYDPELSGDSLINWSYAFTVDSGGADDGDYTYQIQATDISGSKTTLDRQLVVDATEPTVEISLPASDGISVNGDSVDVQGTASDNRAVDSVYYYIGDSVPAALADWTVLTGVNTWNFTFDSLSLKNTAGAENFSVHLKALDKAGNISSDYTRIISIDQESDRPVISFNDIDKDQALAANNVLVGATTITGIIEDDDLIDPSLFSGAAIEISLDGGAWTSVSQLPDASGKFVIWKHDISGIDEGGHTVKIRARDNLWAGEMGGSSSDYTVSPYDTNFNWAVEDGVSGTGVPFILNLGPPAIEITEPANYTFHNTDVVISGGVGDANGVASMSISTDNGLTWIDSEDSSFTFTQLDSTSWTWSYTLTVAADGADDGTYSYIVSAEDTYGSVSVENGQFTVDATKPEVFIDLPADGNTVNGSLEYTGRASDNIQVVNVYYALDSTLPPAPSTVDLTDPSGPYYDIGSTYAWTHTLDTTAVNNTAVDTDYYFTVVGVDGAGNLSDRQDVHVVINQESDKPVISFSSIAAGGSHTDNLLPSSGQISGTISDDDQVDVSTISYMIYKDDGVTQLLGDWTGISGPPGSDTSLGPWTHVVSQVMDVDDLDSDTDLTELISIPDGKYQIAVRSADTYYAGDFSTGGFQWSQTDNIIFAVDTALPQTDFTTPASNGGYINDNFFVAGTASDAGGIQNVDIQFGTDSVITLYNDPTAASASVPWTTDLTDSGIEIAGHPDDGTLTYKVNITDAYGKLKTYERFINVDTQVPVIDSLSLVNNDTDSPLEVNGSVLIQGIPSDDQTFVDAIYYITSDSGVTYPAAAADPTGEGWTLLPNTSSLNFRFNSESLVGGPAYETHLLIEDAAGNRSADDVYVFNYTVDQTGNNPLISWDTASGSLMTTSQSLNGSITDDDGIDASTIEIFIDGVSADWESVSQQGTDGPQISFVHTIADTAGLVEREAAYTLRVRVNDLGEDFTDDTQDVAAASAVSSDLTLYLDDSDPVATITQLDTGITTSATLTGAYINEQFVISGTAADGVKVSEVRARLEGEDFAAVTNTGTNFSTWSWTRTGLSLSGSSVVMDLEVQDFHGNVTPYSFTLLVDVAVPTVGFTTDSSNPDTTTGAYNGEMTIRGEASDNVQLNAIYYKLDGTGNPTTVDPVADGWTAATGTYSWNFTFDTIAHATLGNSTDTNATIYAGVVSVDQAGNISDVSNLSFITNQASDSPVLTITQPTAGGVIESTKKVIGSLSDDDTLASLEIRIDRNDDGDFDDTDEGYVAVSQPAVISGSSINFEHDLSGLSDGSYRIQMRAYDTVNASSYYETVSSVISFDIDTLSPEIALDQMTIVSKYTGVSDTVITTGFNGSYINNNTELEFSATDSSGIASVEVSIDDVVWDPASGTGPYTFTLDAASLSEGTNNISYRAKDNRNKTTTGLLTVIVDKQDPSVSGLTLINNDVLSPTEVNGSVNIQGVPSDDETLVDAIYVKIVTGAAPDDPGDDPASEGWTLLDTTANINYRFNSYDLTDTGSYTAYLILIDAAGNRTTVGDYTAGAFTIDQSGNTPVINMETANNTLLTTSDSISGTITDDDSVDVATLTVDIDGGGAGVVSGAPGSNGTSVEFSHSLASLTERIAPYVFEFDVSDAGEDFTGTDDDVAAVPAGTATLNILVDDSAPAAAITGIDNLNNGVSDPKATLSGVYISDYFVLTGTAEDGVQVSEVRAKLTGESFAAVSNTGTNYSTWSWTRSGLSLSGESVTLTIEVKDYHGRTTTYTNTILVDTESPTAGITTTSINPLTETGAYNGDMTISGTAGDNAQLSTVYYKLDSVAAPVTTDPDGDGWTATTGTYSWSFDFDTINDTGYGNNTNVNSTVYVGVASVDSAGNVSGVSDFSFIINQGSDNPVLEYSSITEGGNYGDNEIPISQKISGTVQDDDGVDASTIQFRLYDDSTTPVLITDWTNVSSQPSTDAVFGSWSHTFDPTLSDGKYQIEVRVSDVNDVGTYTGSYDWTQSAKVKFTADSLSPTGSIETLSVTNFYDATSETPRAVASGMLVHNSFDLVGTATDGNGIASVQISVDGAGFTDVDSFTEPDWDHTVSVTRGGGSDGDLPLIVRITDSVGKITDKTLTVTVDTVEPATELNYTSEMTVVAGTPTISGSLSKIIGKVEDPGSISNVDRVDLFFVKDSSFYSPRASENTPTGGVSLPADSSYIISVDNRYEIDSDSEAPGDNDDFLEGLRSKGTFDEWYAYMESTILPDGPLQLHQAGYDEAGNRTITASNIQVSNYPPSITSLFIWGTEYPEDDVKVKLDGSDNVVIMATDESAIDTGSYELEVIEQYNRDGGDVGTLNASYDASDTYLYSPDITGTYTLNTSVFTDDYYYRVQARVQDDSENIVTKDFYMWVYDSTSDASAPDVEIDALTQDNVGVSGGHIEESGFSPDVDSQADISGNIKFTGTVFDNNSNPTVDIEISYNSGGNWTTLTGNATTINESGSAQDGYLYDWYYNWDSSGVTGVAVEDLQVRAHGTDGGSNDGYSAALTVDVVPYITGITTGFETGLKAFIKRSALGKYTVASGTQITISGYNLAGTTAGSVRIGNSEGTYTYPAIDSGTSTEQVVTLDSTNNGAVAVETNGIFSRNNTNTNTLSQNEEASTYYPDRNDDRYIALWLLTDTGYSGTEATMRPVRDAGGNQTDMDWMYVTTSNTLMLSGTKMTFSSFGLSGGDFGYNNNGTRLWSFLHDSSWWTDETNATNEQFHGSIQWSIQNGYTYTSERDEAFNWNIAAQTGRLGLGNMVYQAGTTGQIDRYENLQMKLYGDDTGTANYVSYYDGNSAEKGISFVSFNVGTSVNNSLYDLGSYTTGTGTDDWYSTVRRDNDDYNKAYGNGSENQRATGIGNPEYAGTTTIARHNVVPGADASTSYVMTTDSSGAVYLAWYDPDTDASGGDGFDDAGIKFMYNTDPVASPTSWTDPETVVSNASNTTYSYLAMAVDPDGGIHIAYQDDNTGYLNYTYAASRTDVGATMNTMLLDALFSSGQYNSMVVKNFDTSGGTDYRPVITTFSSAYTGTSQSLRLLYPAGDAGTVNMSTIGAGADSDEDFTGNWESIAIPASSAPESANTFIETDGTTSGQGNPLIGYNATTMEEAEFVDLP